MGGHGHGPPYTIPDYKSFVVKGVPQLEELEQALAKKGLKDPWIRNEAWRYHPGFGSKSKRAFKFFFRGLPIGVALTAITVGVEMALGGGDDHGHHGH
ncbi:NADH dehydrogenase [ubiquinone] 1 beta subcomplex subunit 3 [Anticarsia gemmatalis]|uniref:NADH dehydrogenase [ubiquinone] 1 beta subcomplex subunit 3 n=1 Tax=Anticarsia gemmatalis TaxID=129554 RepID=UPI003F775E48